MSPTTDNLRTVLGRVAAADRRGEPVDWDARVPVWPAARKANAETLWMMLSEVDRLIRAAKAMRDHLEGRLLADVQARGPIRLGDDVYYPGRDAQWRWADPETSPRGLLEWATLDCDHLGQALDRVVDLVRLDPRAVRVTTLRAAAGLRAARQGDPHPDLAAAAAVDTFLVKEGEDTPILSHHRTTLSSCPKWALALEHGQRRAPRKAPKEDQ